MSSIIENLYYGLALDTNNEFDSEYIKLRNEYSESIKLLMSKLDIEGVQLLKCIIDLDNQLNEIICKKEFIQGLKTGARLIMEIQG